ncbi:dehydrogenase, partial [Oryctes borbonicus]
GLDGSTGSGQFLSAVDYLSSEFLGLIIANYHLVYETTTRMFKGKVVLITGASSGIGAATAKHFSTLGASLSLSGRNVENLSKVAEDCIGDVKPLLIIGEITKENDVKNIINKTIEHFGKLDVLINNAGVIETGGIENTNLEQYDRVFNVNVRSVYYLTMLAVPHLEKTKGNIVNISSVTGIRASSGLLSYCMSKAAINQFTECVALDLAPKQIRVNSICPGVVVTELHKRGGMNEEQYAEFLSRCKTSHAPGRPGKPEEVANTIAFVASDHASFITGAIIPVDGGRHSMCPR